jgi:hypothetical protein
MKIIPKPEICNFVFVSIFKIGFYDAKILSAIILSYSTKYARTFSITTFNITTLRIMTFSIKTLSINTFSTKTLSKAIQNRTFSIITSKRH